MEQSELFATVLRDDMTDWSDMFDDEGADMEEALINKAKEINEK